MRFLLLLGAAVTLLGCSGSDKKADDGGTNNAVAETPDLTESKCLGNRVPPTGWLQETAYIAISTPNATEEAGRLASEKLRDKICQGYRCNAIESKITVWNTQSDAAQACAMAVVKGAEVEAFKRKPREDFEKALTTAGQAIVGSVKKKKEPRIAIDNIRDVGVDGGPRAEWLIDRMHAALSKGGATIPKLPPKWSGLELPKNVDGIVRGRITPMHGQEAMLEVTWTLDLGDSYKGIDPIAFPELIGPSIDPSTKMDDLGQISSDKLAVRFDARPGGGLCVGQFVEMTLETASKQHVRVIDLYGAGDKGLVIYASEDPLAANTPTTFGPFQALKAEGVAAERFILLGAEDKAALGQYQDVKVPCRLPSNVASRLSKGQGVPKGVFAANRSYRIIDGEECSDVDPTPAPSADISTYPNCF